MISSVTKKGRSFVGAALYYLHDKGALTDDRIAFTHTENLATADPHLAARMMAYTAMHQSEIKQDAGGSSKGRKLTLPVYAYSLSWHPTEEPTREEMIEAAQQTLKTLKLNGHEVIMAAHNDEEHPHIHVLVNRVHPETGIAAKLSNDRLRLSEWAEEYERERGQIFCDKRVENNERRRNGEWVKHPEKQHDAEYHRWRQEETRQRVERREQQAKNLSDHHKREQDRLSEQKQQRTTERRAELRELYRSEWAKLYSRQKRETAKLGENQRTAWGRLTQYLRTPDTRWQDDGSRTPLPRFVSGALKAIRSGNDAANALKDDQQQQRNRMADRVNGENRRALKQINADYEHDRAELLALHREEQAATKKALSLESQKHARDLVSGKKRAEFDRLHPYSKVIPDLTKKRPQPKARDKEADRTTARDTKRRDLKADLQEAKEQITRDTKAKQGKKATERKDSYRAFRDLADETTRDKEAEKIEKKKAKRKDSYRAFRDLADETTRDKEADRTKEKKATKRKDSYRAFRDLADDATRDREPEDTGRKRNDDPEPPPKPKPPRPPTNNH